MPALSPRPLVQSLTATVTPSPGVPRWNGCYGRGFGGNAVTTMQPNPHFDALAEEHRRWLSPFDARYVRNWEKLYASDNEAAMTEASIRRMLQTHGSQVEPNEELAGDCGGPDFRCSIARSHFYVEVTCISIATAEKRTGLKNGVTGFSPFNVTGMVEAIFNECMNKAPQCGGLNGPALVAVGTFHATAAMVGFKKVQVNMVLAGKTNMAWDLDTKTGQQVGEIYQTTEIQKAAFLCPDEPQEVGFARCSISGVLMCGVGLSSLPTIGVLHPNPVRPFDPALLPGIEFGRVEVDRTSGVLKLLWPNRSWR